MLREDTAGVELYMAGEHGAENRDSEKESQEALGAPSGDNGEQLAIHLGRAELALSAAQMGEFEWDFAHDLFIVSPRMAEITGLPPGPTPAQGGEYAYGFVHPADLAAVRSTVTERLARDGDYHVRYRMIRPNDGRTLWMESRAAIVRGPGGSVIRVIGVVRDISAAKAEEDEREALVAELNHRVKNVLAAVQSLAAQTARKTVSLDSFLKTLAGRLEAMAAAHALLTATRWRGAEIGDIAAAELGGLALGRAVWSGPEIVLNSRATNSLALALHELATNAVKFGALSTELGRVDLTWRRLADGGFELQWSERGGPPVGPPGREGFGVTLIEKVTGRELGGEARLDFPPDGARATLRAGPDALAPAQTDRDGRAVNRSGAEPEASAQSGASTGELGLADIAGVKVLIVEDSVLLALELEASLVESGAVVVGTASSLDEALELLEQRFDAVVLDADLAGRSAAPMAAALAKRGTPFIIATGFEGPGAPLPGFAVPLVRKPYNVHQIASALVQALEGRPRSAAPR